jgi:5-formyltetrahydrofolate cyclo-ligase
MGFIPRVTIEQDYFSGKPNARTAVWDRLEREGVARFPFPPHGRIPNFAGAKEAAERLFEHEILAGAKRIKVNPDAPQRPVRALALARGITVYVPTPRLKGGFRKLDPRRIPKEQRAKAAALSKADDYAVEVPLSKMPQLDAIVVGSVVVTRDGYRCGKGEGYADIEYAILRELGHAPAPILTTVHPFQIVRYFPAYEHDTPLCAIATPTELIRIDNPAPPPRGIDWSRLPEERLAEMPILAELRSKAFAPRPRGRTRK